MRYRRVEPVFKDYIKRRLRDLSPDERAGMSNSVERMAWVLQHLEKFFPRDEFSADAVLATLGTDQAAFDADVKKRVVPTPEFLQLFVALTGAPMEFLITGEAPSVGDGEATYEDAVDLARLAGIGPDELIRLIRGAQAAKE